MLGGMPARAAPGEGARGHTTIEVLMAVVLLVVMTAAGYGMITILTKGHLILQSQLEVQQNPRVALDRFVRDTLDSTNFVIYDSGGAEAASGVKLKLERVTILSAGVTQGAARTSIQVDDASLIQCGQTLTVGDPSVGQETVTVAGSPCVSGNTVTLTGGTWTYAHVAGEQVTPIVVYFTYDASSSKLCYGTSGSCSTDPVLAENITALTFSSVQTTLTAAVTNGDSTLTVASTAGFSAGDKIDIVAKPGSGENTEKDLVISALAPTTITLDGTIYLPAYDHTTANTRAVWLRQVRVTLTASRVAEGTDSKLTQTFTISSPGARVQVRN